MTGAARPVPPAAAMIALNATVMAAAIRIAGDMSVCRPRLMQTEKPAKPTAEASAARSPSRSASARPSPIMIATPVITPAMANHMERTTGSRSTSQPRNAANSGAALIRKSAFATVECMTPHT